MSSGSGTRPRSRPSDKVAKQRNPSGKSNKDEPEPANFRDLEPDTDEKDIEKTVVDEDPEEDYEADNYDEDESDNDQKQIQQSEPAPRVLTRVADN